MTIRVSINNCTLGRVVLILLIIQQGNGKAKATQTYIYIHRYTKLVAVGAGGGGQFMNFWGWGLTPLGLWDYKGNSITRGSYSTNKSEPNGAFTLPTRPVPPSSLSISAPF